MILDKLLVEQIAYLARLSLSESEKDDMLVGLNEILIWLQKLDELHESDLYSLEMSTLMSEPKLRKDIPTKTLTHEAGLQNAPDKDTNYFRTPPFNKI